MSSRTSRKAAPEALAHPDIEALMTLGKDLGEVSAHAVRQTSESAGLAPQQYRALLKALAAAGISVSLDSEDTKARPRVAAAASTTRKVTASTSKKAAAKKAPAKKAATKPAKKAAAEEPRRSPRRRRPRPRRRRRRRPPKAGAKKTAAKKAATTTEATEPRPP